MMRTSMKVLLLPEHQTDSALHSPIVMPVDESSAPTATTDRVCTTLTRYDASQYESTAPTATETESALHSPIVMPASMKWRTYGNTDRICTITNCDASQYESNTDNHHGPSLYGTHQLPRQPV